MKDVVFVQMPFASVERPSLALGLLASALRRAALSVEVVYANIAFAETIGLSAYWLVGQSYPNVLLGDWLFVDSAFREAAERLPRLDIQDGLLSINRDAARPILEERGQSDLKGLLREIRGRAAGFVDELCADILGLSPKVVACTSMFDQHVASLALLRRVKELAPAVLTVLGGANCAGPMGRATQLSFPQVDFTVTGEFDQHAGDFFRALCQAGGHATAVVPLPPNVLGPEARGDAPRPSPAWILHDMDKAPTPDYDDYFEQIYSSSISEYVISSLQFETSRGCWWGAKQHCTFCGLNAEGMVFRKKSPARAVEEIRALTGRYRISRCAASDNIIDMSYFETVLPELAADEREYQLFYETKANLKRDHVQAMADAGCTVIQPGLESLHDETLRVMKKGTTACSNIQLLKYCLEFGIHPAWSILCNFPSTEPEWVADAAIDFPALFHLHPPMDTSLIRFDRFSPYHERAAEYGLLLEPVPAYRHVYPLDEAVLKDLAYFFQDSRGVSPAAAANEQRARRMVQQWRADFFGPQRAQLVIDADDGCHMRVRDTRGCTTTEMHELGGHLAMLLRVLEGPATRPGLRGRLQSAGWAGVDEGELCELLDELLTRRLIWRSSTQYVALPTPPPKRPSPPRPDQPLGNVDIRKYLLQTRRLGGVL
jgi:ribosomal peptide maturation radical SAM protein 1